MKDNYFRTSSSSSEDEYDSDDSARKGDHGGGPTANTNKTQPLGSAPPNIVNATTAGVAATVGSGQSNGSDGNK